MSVILLLYLGGGGVNRSMCVLQEPVTSIHKIKNRYILCGVKVQKITTFSPYELYLIDIFHFKTLEEFSSI